MLTQSIKKGCPRIERQTMEQAVDSKFDTYRSYHPLGVGRLGRQRNLRETAEQEGSCDGSGLENRSSRDPNAWCRLSSMTGAFVPGFDPSSLIIVKRLTGGHVPAV
jgi:hypothetical protein